MTLTATRRDLLKGVALATPFLATPALARTNKAAPAWPKVQAVLDQWVMEKRVPGAIAGLGRGLEPMQFLVAGTQSFNDPTAMSADSLFRAYSQTKPVTGIAAMMLIEDGKMKLDQSIADFLPAFANMKVLNEPETSLASRPARAPITMRNLLTHTGGLGYTIISKGPLLDAYLKLGLTAGQVSRHALPGLPQVASAPSLAEFADRLATLPLAYEPGERWSYSVSLDLMGRVIEVVSGMPFDAFLQKRIFDPLGMTSTWFQVPANATNRLTTNHFDLDGKPLPIDLARDSVYLDKPAFPFGGSGLVSTPRDWDRFLLMLMGEGAIGKTRLIKPDTARLAMSNLVPPGAIIEGFAKGQGFGAGGRVNTSQGPNGEGIGTFGWGGAASTNALVDRTKRIRSTAWIQLMTRSKQYFPDDISKAVYAT